MRRITLWLFSTVAALVLLFSYRTSTNQGGTAPVAATAEAPTGGAAPAPNGTATPASNSSSTSRTSSGAKTYRGSAAQTLFGPVQVTITVTDGRITHVVVPTYPNGTWGDKMINASALPVLRRETLSAQSAEIDAVSGATVTSDGYKQSLQAALDAAHLA